MSDHLLEEIKVLSEAVEGKTEQMQKNRILGIISRGFVPLMVYLTLFQFLAPYIFEGLLFFRTAVITSVTLMSIHNLATVRNDPMLSDAMREFLISKENKMPQISWLERVPEICSLIITICLAIVLYSNYEGYL
jgi:hypothetical protein